ncbi:MAG: Nif3-like dinuclear metal center hexameric protein [Desulfuromonadales bacterium]
MEKKKIFRIQDLLGVVNGLFPPSLAEEWDNVGLQVGDPSAELTRVLVCLDVTPEVLKAAAETGAEAVVSHHPLVFRPLQNLTPRDETGQLLMQAVRDDVAVISAHTNLDRAAGGLNDWLAARLGVTSCEPLAMGPAGDLLKLSVFVPCGYEGPVSEAIFAAGAGSIGDYDCCSFRTTGTGTFRPGEHSNPFIGESGQIESAREVRLETILPRERLGRVLDRMTRAHPYEEVAYDLVSLLNQRTDIGLGRIGRLQNKTTLGEFAATVREALGAQSMRVVGNDDKGISKVALCGGSGSSLLTEAVRRGADVLLTGDIKYHEARAAQGRGIGLIDAGHFATEHLMVEEAVRVFSEEAARRKIDIEFHTYHGEEDPFRSV